MKAVPQRVFSKPLVSLKPPSSSSPAASPARGLLFHVPFGISIPTRSRKDLLLFMLPYVLSGREFFASYQLSGKRKIN